MDILRSTSIAGIFTCATVFVLLSGEINLACGAQATITAAIIGALLADGKFPYWLAVVIGLAVAVLSGIICCFLIVRLRMPAFIATIDFATVLDAGITKLCNNRVFYSNKWPKSYGFLGQTLIGGIIPIPLIFFAVIAVFMWFITEKTRFGRKLFSVGRNSAASRQVGIKVEWTKYLAFMIAGFLCGIGGWLQTSITKNVAMTLGQDFMLPAISAAMLGSTFLKPGRFNVPGIVLASFLSMAIRNGITMAAPSTTVYAVDLTSGIILPIIS